MKRVKVTMLVRDSVSKMHWKSAIEAEGGELEHYSERLVPKEKGLAASYSFDSLLEAAKEFAEGVWLIAKSAVHMMGWAAITIVEGVRWLWKGAFKKTETEVKK